MRNNQLFSIFIVFIFVLAIHQRGYSAEGMRILDLASIELDNARIKTANEARRLAWSAYFEFMELNVDGSHSLMVEAPFTVAFRLDGFCALGDRIWPSRIIALPDAVVGILWLNAETGKTLVLAGQWDQDKEVVPYPVVPYQDP